MASPHYALDLPFSTRTISTPIRRQMHRYTRDLLYMSIILVILVILLLLTTDIQFTHSRSISNRSEISNESLALRLEREVRVLCWVMTTPKNHKTKALSVRNTWGKRCNRLIFVTSEESEDLETLLLPVEDKYELIWGKTREAFRYIYEHYGDEADWFMKADDDTYVFVDNLRYMLYEYTPETPIYFGYKLSTNLSDEFAVYGSGGAGYVLSKEALRRFVEVALLDEKKCAINKNDGSEDLNMGYCLNMAGVIAGDSRDSMYKHRFWLLSPTEALLSSFDIYWLHKMSYYHIRQFRYSLSAYPVSFHYIKPETMRLYEYLIYEFSLYGRETIDEKLPTKLNPENITVPEMDNSYNKD